MSEVKIFERVTVDEPQNVEIAIYNLTGKKVPFELVRKFILNEKNTMFYLDQKMNSSTEPGYYSDYLWLDTGFRDDFNNPIMICLHNGSNGFVGHYTGPIKELVSRFKILNRKNIKDIEKNYSRFLSKYKTKSDERNISCITSTKEYAIASANHDAADYYENDFAIALRKAGVDIKDEFEEPKIEEEIIPVEEELTVQQNEITIGLLLEQMESMQTYIDELLERVEGNERTSKEEIERLKTQNNEYKIALRNIRLYNSENGATEELSEDEKKMGHNLLGRNEKILILGNTDIRVAEMRAIAKDYGFEKADFEFITEYEKVKKASERIHGSNRFAAIIFGNCPHKVAGIGNYASIIDEFKDREDCSISIDARTEAGGLKITKQSFRKALTEVYLRLKEQDVA